MNETKNETGIVVMSPDVLTSIIRDELNRAITEFSKVAKPQKQDTDILTIDDAVTFLGEHGLPTKKRHIYNLVTNNRIPYRKRGRYLNFSKQELLAWLDARTVEGGQHNNPALTIAKSAMRKR